MTTVLVEYQVFLSELGRSHVHYVETWRRIGQCVRVQLFRDPDTTDTTDDPTREA